MRIALVHKAWGRHGGTEGHLRALAAGLAARGHAVEALCARWDPGAPVPEGVRAVQVPWLRGSAALKAASFDRGARWRLRQREAEGGPFDVVVGLARTTEQDVWRAGGGAHGAWAKARGGRVTLTDRLLIAMEGEACRRAHRVVALSRSGAAALLARHGIPPERVVVLPNPVDAARFHPGVAGARGRARAALGIPPDALVLLLVGGGFERKGLAALLRAAALIPPDLKPFVLAAGADPHGDRYRALAAGLGIPLALTGPRDDVEELYGAADVFALPTRFDPCANATLEAMACGLPVVTTEANGAAELLPAGMGIVDAACDPGALARVLTRVAAPGARRALGEAGVRAAVGLSWQAHLSCVEALYADVREMKQRAARDGRPAAQP